MTSTGEILAFVIPKLKTELNTSELANPHRPFTKNAVKVAKIQYIMRVRLLNPFIIFIVRYVCGQGKHFVKKLVGTLGVWYIDTKYKVP